MKPSSGWARGNVGLLLCCALAVVSAPAEPDRAMVAAIEQVALDYVDGQLEGDAKRVASSLHPDLAKRAVAGDGPSARETFPLRRMSADELIALTSDGALKTPRAQWVRSVRVLDIAGNVAVARVEAPWFVDFFHLGRFGTRWLIVNAIWWPRPAGASPLFLR
ncbi:nuclear transport factor 2 family protein [Sphingomonas sp. DG1-23]|uniref:nuclear transport factor 2 family protein n=1 Tax=Sphingomonas sp. DG1-23 TaxID=3068316 RepID=UPI0027401171|nr:nuclear transport factor 2 family protein [Sphingomonas sp. DG1-23]MDP5279537.1 nuclear transport factor 2 family protein [Sphingomonas sp. DG1-23]